MLSIYAIKNAGQASQYFASTDNYYLMDKEILQESSAWYGKGAQDLNLSGQVEPELFLRLLEGKLPSGQQLGKINEQGEIKHRPATDITLSAPKSISLLVLVGGDKRLLEAHNKAVRATLDAIEKMAAEARISINGEPGYEKTKNLVIALFQHTTSRELDAQLHDHGVIMNMTKRSDCQWRSLSSLDSKDKSREENGFREFIYRNQHYFGLIYNSSLAKNTCDIGYDIVIKDQYGNFEIKGVPQSYIENSSKRRLQILSRLRDKGLSSARAAEKANLDSRNPKESVDSQSLNALWKADAERQGVDLGAIIEASIAKERGIVETPEELIASKTAKEALSDAIEHLSPFRTKIKHLDLVRTAYVFATGTIGHLEIEAEIERLFKEEELLGKESDYYTTEGLLRQEKDFIKQCKSGVGRSFSLATDKEGICSQILKSEDRLQLIDVKGLTHEKRLLEELIHVSEEQGLHTVVLHQGRLQAERLQSTIRRDSSSLWKSIKNLFKPNLVQTVAGFSTRYEKTHSKPSAQNDIVIVHDAQKLSYRDLAKLDSLAAKTESKIILLNNTRSTEGYSAGSPIKALKEAGFNPITSKTLEKMAAIDIVPTTNMHHDLAQHFANLDKDARNNTQVIALTNKDSTLITDEIRNQLQQKGVLSFQSKEVSVLSTQGLSEAEKRQTKFYDLGDQITFNAYERGQEHYKLIAKDEHSIHLENDSGLRKSVLLAKENPFLVTKTRKIALSIGEQLVNEKNTRLNLMIFNRGEVFEVKSLRPDGVMLKYNKSDLFLSNEELSSLTLGYNYVRKPGAVTKTPSETLVALQDYQLNKNVVGELTEFSSKIKVFTQDKEKAIAQFDKPEITLTITDVAKGNIHHLYRDISYATDPINKDLEALSFLLSKDLKDLDKTAIANLAISYTTAKLSEREAAFKHKDLLREALHFALGKVDIQDIETAIEEKAKQGDLIHANTYWISKEALALEEKILANNKNEQNKLAPIADTNRLLSLPSTLTQGQKDAISLSLTTTDRFVTVQGLSGVGKTTMMQYLQTIAHEKDYEIIGLAPMHTSKDELIANGIKAITVAQFLTENKPYSDKTVFIVDEVSMVGNRDYLNIQNKIIQYNARSLFSGDITQLQSPTSGIPHELTVKTGSQKVAKMSEIIRQNNSPTLKKAVIHASNREIKSSFTEISSMNPEAFIKRQEHSKNRPSSSVVTVACCIDDKSKKMDYSPIYQAIADDYLTRIPEHQEKTLVIAHTHEDRKEINKLIREGLQEQGRVSHQEVESLRLAAKSMSKAELMHVKNYKEGDVLRFDASYSVVKKGDYFTVTGIDAEKNYLHCLSETSENFSINPARFALRTRMSVYTKEICALAPGDKIRLRLTNKPRGHIANKEYKVERLYEGRAYLQSQDKKKCLELQLDEKKDCHWDYAYTRTAFGAQSATISFVLALELAKRKLATTHRSHEIDITRSQYQVTIYTEDEGKLIERLAKLEGDKLSAWQIKSGNNPKYDLFSETKNKESKEQSLSINSVKLGSKNVNLQELTEQLTLRIKSLSEELLGKPNGMSTADNLRYGNRGSLSINTKNGLWKNFESGEGGNALQLITATMGFRDFKDTIAYAKGFLNQPDFQGKAPQSIKMDDEKKPEKNSNNKKAYAEKLYRQSMPIKGTIAERYLKEYRKLNHYNEADLRFVPKISTYHDKQKTTVSGLLCIARDKNGALNHVQVIRLDPITGDKDYASKIDKQTYGAVLGCPIELNKKADSDITYLVEGVETGLSILEVNPKAHVFATAGKSNFPNIDLSRLKNKVVICVDNDGASTFKDSTKDKGSIIKQTVDRLEEAGKKVSIILPKNVDEDLNDVLINEGVSALKKYLDNPIDARSLLLKEALKDKNTTTRGCNRSEKNDLAIVRKEMELKNQEIIDSYHKDNIIKYNEKTIGLRFENTMKNIKEYDLNFKKNISIKNATQEQKTLEK